jgi:hypothetical protein
MIKQQRIIDELILRLNLQDSITDTEIIANTENSLSYALAHLGIALNDLGKAIKEALYK